MSSSERFVPGRLPRGRRWTLAVGAVPLAALLLSGCGQVAAYRSPIARFQQASAVVIASTREQYDLANKAERDAEIDRRVARRETIDLEVLNGEELRPFGPEDLAARISALDAVAEHGALMLALASADAPVKAADAARSLGDALVPLTASLGRTGPGQFRSSAEGFAAIAAEVTRMVLAGDIGRALDQAVIASEQGILPLIALLSDEMTALHERWRGRLSAARVEATTAYREELDKPTPSADKLRTAAAKIKAAEDAWYALPALLSTGSGLAPMAEAHRELVAYAKSSKTPQDLADLVDATDAFATRAASIAGIMRTLLQTGE